MYFIFTHLEPKAMYVGFFVHHWQQFHVANKAFTAAILSLTIFFYCTFNKVKMTHSLLDSMLPKMHTFNTQPKQWFTVKGNNGFHIVYCMQVELKHEK